MTDLRDRPALAELIELLGTKWVMRILWELRGEALTFRSLQKACGGVSPSVLNQRLALLQQAALVTRSEGGYTLDAAGHSLMTLYTPLADWAEEWQRILGKR